MDPDPGGPKTYGSYGSGSATLPLTMYFFSDDETRARVHDMGMRGVQCFSYYFCLVIEGSGSGAGSESVTNGSATLPITIFLLR